FLREFVTRWRELLVAKYSGEQGLHALGLSEDDAKSQLTQVEAIEGMDLQDLVHLARTGADAALRSSYPKYAFEALLVRMATREPVKDLGKILFKLQEKLKAGPQQRSEPAPSREPPPQRTAPSAAPAAKPAPQTPASAPE